MGEEIIIQDENGKKYSVLRVLDADTKKIIDDLSALVIKKDKRIADLEYSLLDMILQFADEDKNSISTMGLSALETAFAELDLDDPMPIKEVHKVYKELAKKYFEERCNK